MILASENSKKKVACGTAPTWLRHTTTTLPRAFLQSSRIDRRQWRPLRRNANESSIATDQRFYGRRLRSVERRLLAPINPANPANCSSSKLVGSGTAAATAASGGGPPYWVSQSASSAWLPPSGVSPRCHCRRSRPSTMPLPSKSALSGATQSHSD